MYVYYALWWLTCKVQYPPQSIPILSKDCVKGKVLLNADFLASLTISGAMAWIPQQQTLKPE